MPKSIDLTGQHFGRLTVLRRVENRGRYPCWECKCACGRTTYITTPSLRSGHTISCGCYRKEVELENLSIHRQTHGQSYSRLYRTWANMKARCENPNNHNYVYYGGRGIRVCDESKSFEPFEAWALSNGYSENLTIDRINVDGNYEPANCRWATVTEQNRNKRSVRNCYG